MGHGKKKLSKIALAAAMIGAMVAGPLGAGAGAAEHAFSAQSDGFALGLIIDVENLGGALPAELAAGLEEALASVPGVDVNPFHIEQYLISTSTNATNATTEAISKLATGALDTDPLIANQMGQDKSETGLSEIVPSDALPLIQAVGGALKASVLEGPKVDAEGTLASVSASLEPIGDELPAEVMDLVDAIVDAANDAVAALNDAVDDVLETALGEDAISQLCDDVQENVPGAGDALGLIGDVTGLDPCADVEEVVGALLDLDLPEVPNPLTVPFAGVEGLVNTGSSERDDDGVSKAAAHAEVKAVSLLGGFVTVDIVSLSAGSEAAGTPGSAKNAEPDCTIADLVVGDGTLAVSLDGDSLDVNGILVGGETVPVVGDVLAEVQSAMDELLATLGVDIELCHASGDATEDGTAAWQKVSAFHVEIAPVLPAEAQDALGDTLAEFGIAADQPLFRVVVDPTVQTAASAQPAVAAEVTPALPRTGAPFVATVLTGLMLAVGALAIRRRMH